MFIPWITVGGADKFNVDLLKGIDKNKNTVIVYMGCLTTLYNPLSITFCPFSTFIILDKYLFSNNTIPYNI